MAGYPLDIQWESPMTIDRIEYCCLKFGLVELQQCLHWVEKAQTVG